MKTYKYAQGGNSGPQPPEAIANDPMFKGVRYVGKAKDHYVRKVGGQGADFRMDGEGLKFYGYDDDGLYIEDKNGNLFVAERSGRVQGDAGIKEKLRNPDLTQRERMILLQELEDSTYVDMFEYVRDAYGGKYSDEHDMTQEGASYEDEMGFAPMDTKDLLHNLDMLGSRDKSGEIISGPSEEERLRRAREYDQRTDYGMQTARSYMDGGNTEGGPVEEMEAKIVSAMKGGASDKEISQMVKASGLDKDYVFNWDNVEMRVTSFKKKDHSMYIDPKGRGYGGHGSSKTEDMLERLSDMGRGRKAGKGRRTYSY